MATELELIEAELAKRGGGTQPPMAPPALTELEQIEAELQAREQGIKVPAVLAPAAAGLETSLTLGSSIAGEVAGGARAFYETLTGGMQGKDLTEAVEETRDLFTYKPKTEPGKATIETIGDVLQPVGEGLEAAEEFYGDTLYEIAPDKFKEAAGAYGKSIPTLAMEMMGLGAFKKTAKQLPKVADDLAKMSDDLYSGVDGAVKSVTGKPKIKVFDDAGEFTDEAIEALRQQADRGVDVDDLIGKNLEKSGIITPEQAERFNLFKRRGVDATKANITQATDDFRMQQDLMKESGDMSSLVANQDARLADLAREGKEAIGAVADDLPSTNQSMADVVNNIAETADNAVSEAYRIARENAPEAKNVKLDSFTDAVRRAKPENIKSGGTVDQIRGILRERGVIGPKGWKVQGKIDVETAESIRQDLNRIWSESADNPTARRIISDLKDKIDADVETAAGADVFSDARRAKRKFHELIERRKTSKFDQRKGSLLEDILYNKVNQDDIVKKIRGARPEEFEHLQEFFLEKGGDAGISAWNNMKASVLDEALEKAKGAKTEGGVPSFNGKQFSKVFQQLKVSKAGKGKNAPSKFEVMFSPEEQALINDIIEISELRAPTKSVFAGSGPSAYKIGESTERVANMIDTLLRYGTFGISEVAGANTRPLRNAVEKRRLKRAEKDFMQPEKDIAEAVRER